MGKIVKILISISLIGMLFSCMLLSNDSYEYNKDYDTALYIVASDTYKDLGLEDKLGSRAHIKYMSDMDIISHVNNHKDYYDALLISNSMWTYMLKDTYLTESKSLALSPVVFGVKKDKAEELGLIDKELTNAEIIDLIKDEKIKYIMPSAVRTNAGATSYLGFVNALAGNPQVLTPEHLDSFILKTDLLVLYKSVERNSGSDSYSFELLDKGGYDALVATEASIIEYNLNNEDDPLYMLYPTDGVPMTDNMFTFIGNDADKKELFLELRDYFTSEEGQKLFKDKHYRTWYGGTNENPGSDFRKEWGTDTSKIIKVTSFPSKAVMDKAFYLYIYQLRKPASTTFVLDYSGSMWEDGLLQLQDATEYILDNDVSSADYLQFSSSDLVTVVYFYNGEVFVTDTVTGDNVSQILEELKYLSATGGTPLYESAVEALKIATKQRQEYDNQYNYSVVLMTDGAPTGATIFDFEDYYEKNNFTVPIYTIAFGKAKTSELREVAEITGGRYFDGRKDLIEAFKAIRGYN